MDEAVAADNKCKRVTGRSDWHARVSDSVKQKKRVGEGTMRKQMSVLERGEKKFCDSRRSGLPYWSTYRHEFRVNQR